MGYNDSARQGSICFEELSPDEFDNLRQILRSIFQFTQFHNCKALAKQLDISQLRTQLVQGDAICSEDGGCD